MNLSKKQLEVLVDEIYHQEILPNQKKQLQSIQLDYKKQIKKDIEKNHKNLIKLFDMIDGKNIIRVTLSGNFMKIFGSDGRWSSDFSNIDGLVDYVYGKTIKKEFSNRFGEEITQDMIERAIILETIGSNNIDELISGVKKRLSK